MRQRSSYPKLFKAQVVQECLHLARRWPKSLLHSTCGVMSKLASAILLLPPRVTSTIWEINHEEVWSGAQSRPIALVVAVLRKKRKHKHRLTPLGNTPS
jgi:hypothetical protein